MLMTRSVSANVAVLSIEYVYVVAQKMMKRPNGISNGCVKKMRGCFAMSSVDMAIRSSAKMDAILR